MAFWSKKKNKQPQAKQTRTKQATRAPSASKETPRKRRQVPVEVKLLAAEACEAGLKHNEVAEIIGFARTSVVDWHKAYTQGGAPALARRTSTPSTRKICEQLRKRIEQHRRDNPKAGVRRIRDELKRNEALQVSAETVRKVVNEAGLGQPPQPSKRRPPQQRRFERALPNVMWQIDIFTFQLKRMYPVYLVGIIDDHSRYIVGHGLYRQQTAQAVMEVVKGAIGQWGAPRELLSDNGRQFVAWRGKTQFQKEMTRQGVQHVRSAPQHPMTLGKIERFWKTIWTEFLEQATFVSFADACQRIGHWVAYYNHQRTNQAIDGACPADRFYGVASDVQQALQQGCQENSLRIALGQEPKPPLYLLGKLGQTDVRVTREGDDIEVKLGDTICERIRLSPPYEVHADGTFRRGDAADEMEGHGRSAALRAGADGTEQAGHHQRAVRDVRHEPSEPEPGHGPCGAGGHRGAVAEETRAQAQAAGAGRAETADQGQRPAERADGAMETALRGGQGAVRAAAQRADGVCGSAGCSGVIEGKKSEASPQGQTGAPREDAAGDSSFDSDEPWWASDACDDGAQP